MEDWDRIKNIYNQSASFWAYFKEIFLYSEIHTRGTAWFFTLWFLIFLVLLMRDERSSFVPYFLVAIYEVFYFFIIDWLRRDIYIKMDKSGHFIEGDKANKGLQFYPRYLMFSRSLQKEQINSQRVSSCLDLCKTEIELENTKGKVTKSIGKLIIGFIISSVFLLASRLESTKTSLISLVLVCYLLC
jgi:hypothetical protein